MRRIKLPTTYSEQTYASPYWIVRWPHQKRLATAVELLLDAEPRWVLDYGAGDGVVVAEAIERGLSSEVLAYEPVEKYAQRFAARLPSVALVTERSRVKGPCDLILCLGVLEHMPLIERVAFYDLCDETLCPGGQIVIDVPVETGPALALKAAARRVLKGRDQEYTLGELARYSLGAIQFDPVRYDPGYEGTWIHDHRGFDHRLLQRELGSRFEITRRIVTPLPRLPAAVNQEVFVVAGRL